MKNIILLLLAITIALNVFGQTTKVKGNLSTSDTADLSILNIFPDSFPRVSVVFKAETRKGEPLWNLTKDKMRVKENTQNCEVILLEKISKNKPINLGIVIDHSGSMLGDAIGQYISDDEMVYYPKNYIPPIAHAKKAVKDFVKNFNFKKDYISIIGFSGTVDFKLPLSQKIELINSTVDSMDADFSTALYDGVIAGLEQLQNVEGIKVLIVLTDGQDNSSTANWNDVVKKSKQAEIPIYVIGLGEVNKDTLQQIAISTKGKFFYTENSSSLSTIYSEISKQIQAFYNLTYNSVNFSAADSTREIELSFDIDSIYLFTNSASVVLPQEVLAFLKQKELMALEEKEKQDNLLLFGGVASAIVLTTGTILFYKNKRRKLNFNQPYISRVFPIPANDIINVNYISSTGLLQIVNLNGKQEKTYPLTGSNTQFDLSELTEGGYIAFIISEGRQSNSVKFIIQR